MAPAGAAIVPAGAEMTMALVEPPERTVAVGTRVEVRIDFEQRWARGFEVVEVSDDEPARYLLRRMSDDEVLPSSFSEDQIRRERKRGTWWY